MRANSDPCFPFAMGWSADCVLRVLQIAMGGSAMGELDRFKGALKKFFTAQGKKTIFWERNVPVPQQHMTMEVSTDFLDDEAAFVTPLPEAHALRPTEAPCSTVAVL